MPILLLLLLYPFLELWVLIRVGSRIGVVNTLFALVAIGILGAGFAKAQGRFIFQKLQTSLAKGQVPANQVLHGLLIFVGGILFLIPGFISDVVALFLVLPGTRHLIVGWLKAMIAKKVATGAFRVFATGAQAGFDFGGFKNPKGPFGGSRPPFGNEESRDVSPKVIDVTPISSKTQAKDDNPSDGDKPSN